MKKLFTLFVVAALAFAANAATLTVAEGTETNGHFPMYGLYCDAEGTISQVIYPADMLADMVGQQITEVKFYTSSAISENLEGCVMNFALKIVDENEFSSAVVYNLGGIVNGTVSPIPGETELVLTLNEPFLYEGGNLLIGTEVIVSSGWKGTYFYGVVPGLYCGCYQFTTSWDSTPCYTEPFLPMATFTYEVGETPEPPVEPTEKTGAPVFNGYTTDGIHAYFVEVVPTEPSVIYYRVQYPDGTWTDWAEYEEVLSFEGDGKYRVEAYAVAPGKLPSEEIAYEFVVAPITGIEEMMNGKTVAGVRYFNLAGQEMTEANGMTIVVTTYTDGTTSAVKVMK